MSDRNPTPVLAAFARNEADLDTVFRALVEFDGWLAPVAQVQEPFKLDKFGTQAWYGADPQVPADELWLFTDAQAADRAEAAGARLGAVGSPLPGTTLFARPSQVWGQLRVNPYSPPDLTWNVPPEAFGIAGVWAEAVAFERELVATRGDKDVFARRREVFAFLHPHGPAVTCPDSGGLLNPAAVCTAPDCVRAFLARLPGDLRASLKTVSTTGVKVLELLPDTGIDGVLVNPAGPGPSVVIPFAEMVPLQPGQLPVG